MLVDKMVNHLKCHLIKVRGAMRSKSSIRFYFSRTGFFPNAQFFYDVIGRRIFLKQ